MRVQASVSSSRRARASSTTAVALHYTSSSEAFAPLNGISGVFEFDVDRDDNTRGKIGEWK
jgi:hypothetical protein